MTEHLGGYALPIRIDKAPDLMLRETLAILLWQETRYQGGGATSRSWRDLSGDERDTFRAMAEGQLPIAED